MTLYPRDDILLLYRLYTDDEFHTTVSNVLMISWRSTIGHLSSKKKKIFKETSRNILIQRQKAF